MRSEEEIKTRLEEIDAEIENLNRKKNASTLDAIIIHEMKMRRKTLLWCLE